MTDETDLAMDDAPPENETIESEPQVAPTLDDRDHGQLNQHRRAIFDLPVEVIFAVGRARPTVKELLQLSRDSLVTLDAKIDDPVEVIVGKRVIARGQLQEVEGKNGRLAVRLTEIVDTSDPF